MTACVKLAAGNSDLERVTNHLRGRYAAMVDRFPLFRDTVAESTYIRANRRAAMRTLRGECWHVRDAVRS